MLHQGKEKKRYCHPHSETGCISGTEYIGVSLMYYWQLSLGYLTVSEWLVLTLPLKGRMENASLCRSCEWGSAKRKNLLAPVSE